MVTEVFLGLVLTEFDEFLSDSAEVTMGTEDFLRSLLFLADDWLALSCKFFPDSDEIELDIEDFLSSFFRSKSKVLSDSIEDGIGVDGFLWSLLLLVEEVDSVGGMYF